LAQVLLARLQAALGDRYDLEREVGRGGMATVFLAHDRKDGRERDVAVKVLHPALATSLGVERFAREIRTTSALYHPHILVLIDSGVADGLPYYVTPYVEGDTLRARIEREQSMASVRSLELSVVREVRDAALRLEQNRQRIETARVGRELAEQRLDAEQKRFEVGMSTSFLVIQAQRDLAIARDNELRSYLDYQLAAVTFERVQKVGTALGSGTATLR